MEKIKIGTISYEGKTMPAGFSCDEFAKIAFGDTVPGLELLWVPYRDVLIADRCVYRNVSWDQLDQYGFVFGTKIQIDGRPYLCRCLKYGEWDKALDALGKSCDLWNWSDTYFWTQMVYPTVEPNCEIRGGVSARYQDTSDPTVRNTRIGFRPVLEPLITELSDDMIGNNIKVFWPNQKGTLKRIELFVGRLIRFDNYDLVLETSDKIPAGCNWAVRRGQEIVINRDAITEIGEATNGEA